MRIELNSGGLGGGASIDTMQSNISALIERSDTLVAALNYIKTFMYNVNGGVGGLRGVLSDIQSRINTEETRAENLNAAEDKINSFIELTHQKDSAVINTVSKNQAEFLKMNPWAKPECGGDGGDDSKEWYEELWDWLCDTGDAIADTAEKIWDSILSGFDQAADWVEDLIEKIKEFWDDLTTITPTEINNTVFNPDDPGYYGGNQMVFRPMDAEERAEMYEIFKRNHPDIELSDEEFQNYLSKMSNEACGYVALCNTIFQEYEGREAEFEATFGFPMYDENHRPNYIPLEMDLYSQMDNIDPSGNPDLWRDYNPDLDGPESDYDYWNDSTGPGTNRFELEYYLETYMLQHGVNVEVNTDPIVTPELYDNIVASGQQVNVLLLNGDLYNMDGTVAQAIGGHWMTVTGVTEDGKYLVSSWGKQYYIDPSLCSTTDQELEFITVDYE